MQDRLRNLVRNTVIAAIIGAILFGGITYWKVTHPNLQHIVRHGTVAQLQAAVKFAKNLESEDCVFEHRDNWDWSPLMVAAETGKVSMAKVLLEAGANPNGISDIECHNPLSEAVSNGHLEMAYVLIKYGANVNRPVDVWGAKTVDVASQANDQKLFDLLLGKNPHLVKEKSRYLDRTPLHWAVSGNKHDIRFIRYLVHLGADVQARDCFRETPHLIAAECSTPQVLDFLIKQGASPYVINADGFTILHQAVRGNSIANAKYIVQHYPNLVYQANRQSETPYSLAQKNGQEDMINFLRSVGGGNEPAAQKKARLENRQEMDDMFKHVYRLKGVAHYSDD